MLDHRGFYKPSCFSNAVLNPVPTAFLSLPGQQIKDLHSNGSPVIYILNFVTSSAWHTEQYWLEAKMKTVVTFSWWKRMSLIHNVINFGLKKKKIIILLSLHYLIIAFCDPSWLPVGSKMLLKNYVILNLLGQALSCSPHTIFFFSCLQSTEVFGMDFFF